MARLIKLISCIGTDSDLPMVPHFVTHYASLGIAPASMHFILQALKSDAPGLALAREMLTQIGTAPPSDWIGEYTSEDMWQTRRAVQRQIAQRDLWIVNADLDEHYLFPVTLDEIVDYCTSEGVNCVQGLQIDRLSLDGSLAAVAPAPSLDRQFPVSADVALHLFGDRSQARLSATTKIFLHKADVFPRRGGHNPNDEGAPVRFLAGAPLSQFARFHDPSERFQFPFQSLHYKWVATRTSSLDRRISTPGVSPAGLQQGHKTLDYIEQHGRIRLEDVALCHPGDAPASHWRETISALRADAIPLSAPMVRGDGIASVHVVVRSAGERTERAAIELAAAQVGSGGVSIVREVPFSEALRQGFEVGVAADRKWTLCLDADVLLKSGSIAALLAAAEAADTRESPLFEIEGNVADKIFGHWRNAGQHLYRTDLLPKALDRCDFDPGFRRPETQVKKAMARHGYAWRQVDVSMGSHDFEQAYVDVFRTVSTHTRKFARHMPAAERYWRRSSSEDSDFKVALVTLAMIREIDSWAAQDDIAEGRNVVIDRRLFPFNLEAVLTPAGLTEKQPLPTGTPDQKTVDREIAAFVEAEEFVPKVARPARSGSMFRDLPRRAFGVFGRDPNA